MKRLLIKSWPYFTSLAAGIVVFAVATHLQEDYRGLLINISATLLAIPLLFLIYERARGFSTRRLTQELFEYGKLQIDRETLSIANQLIKLLYPYDCQDLSEQGMNTLFNLSKEDVSNILAKEAFLGFQVLKRWTGSEDGLAKVLENPLIVQRMDEDQTIAVVKLLKAIYFLETLHRNIPDLYEMSHSKTTKFLVKRGSEISELNIKLPDRYLLLKRHHGDKYTVTDFGDFAPFEVSCLLKRCTVNPNRLQMLADAIFAVIEALSDWTARTGDQFIVDPRTIRMRVPA